MPAFCVFQPGVDLDIELWRAPLPGHLLGEFGGDLFAVDRLDDIEQRYGFLGLVGLQRADQMQLDVGKFCLQRGPFALRLLHAVLAEDALAGFDHRADDVGIECLGDGDKGNAACRTIGLALGGGDFVTDGFQIIERVGHASCPKVDGSGKAW